MFNASFDRHIFVNVAIRIQLSRESLFPRKLFWKEKHELFAKMEREGDQIKVVAWQQKKRFYGHLAN